jgi:Ser/Thr protein kinase RdoA (MazF antagonist)
VLLYDEARLQRLTAGLACVLPRWGVAEDAALSLLTVSENATFLVAAPDGRIVLRVYRPGYHDEREIRSELAWIEALRTENVVETPRPIRDREGRLLASFHDGEGLRHVAAFAHSAGHEPEADENLPGWFRHLGETAARLHRHTRGWRRPDGFRRKKWNFETIVGSGAYWGDWRLALGLDAPGRAVLERLHRRIEAETAALGEGADRFGLIHGDMRAANLLVDGSRLSVIDFDDCGFSWFGFDFAAAVSFIEDAPVVPDLREAWLAGYREVAPFSQVEERALPMLVMLRRLQLTAWIASHAETPTALSLGDAYTAGTVALAEAYLSKG